MMHSYSVSLVLSVSQCSSEGICSRFFTIKLHVSSIDLSQVFFLILNFYLTLQSYGSLKFLNGYCSEVD